VEFFGYRLKGSARRGAGIAVGAASIVFIGVGTSGVSATGRSATTTNNCTAQAALNKGDTGKVISNDQGTCDVAANSTSNPAYGYIAFSVAADGTTDLVDLFQSVGSDQDFYVGHLHARSVRLHRPCQSCKHGDSRLRDVHPRRRAESVVRGR
jgi:hypothetical protein